MHALIGHNEPNQATSVHTIDNKPYISESKSRLFERRAIFIPEQRKYVVAVAYASEREKRRHGRRVSCRFGAASSRKRPAKSRARQCLTNRLAICDLEDFLKRPRFDARVKCFMWQASGKGKGTKEKSRPVSLLNLESLRACRIRVSSAHIFNHEEKCIRWFRVLRIIF